VGFLLVSIPKNHIFAIYLVTVDGGGVIKVKSENPPHQQP
jgi:hypothetical protein